MLFSDIKKLSSRPNHAFSLAGLIMLIMVHCLLITMYTVSREKLYHYTIV